MTAAAVVFLSVCLADLVVQGTSLARLYRTPAPGRVPRMAGEGLSRTVVCRAVSAVGYVALGLYVLAGGPAAETVTLMAFCAVRITWMANSLLDVRLKHRIRDGA